MLKFWNKKEVSILEQISEQNVIIDVPEHIEHQLKMVDLTKRDLAVLQFVQPYVKEQIKEIVSSFYERVGKEPLLREIINSHSSVERLKKTLEPHVTQMFDGVIDEPYVQHRIRVAHVHVKIGLPNKWYLASFQGLLKGCLEAISPHIHNQDDYNLIQSSISKIFNFEQQIVVEEYEQENERIREDEYLKKQNIQREVEENVSVLYQGIEDSNHAIESIVERSMEVTALVQEGTASAENISTMSHEGSEILHNHSDEISNVVTEIGEVCKGMEELSAISNEMKNIVRMVNEIADETHLLSLNARIEASRAGSFGKTFAVVADRFQTLSDKTKESTIDVSDLIERTVSKIKVIHQELTKSEQMILTGQKTIEEAKKFFGQIVERVDTNKEVNKQILSEVESVSSYLEEINETSQQIQAQTQSLRAIISTLTE